MSSCIPFGDAAQIHQNGPALLAATEDRQQTELLNRRAATPALNQTAADAQRDLAQLAEELATRPETAHQPARMSPAAARLLGPSVDIEADITRPRPDLERDLER